MGDGVLFVLFVFCSFYFVFVLGGFVCFFHLAYICF